MPDYFREVGGAARVLAIVGLSLTTLIMGTALLLAIAMLLCGVFQCGDGVPVWPSAALFAFMTFASGWMLLGLLRRTRSANGVTMMPVWFIQLLGVLFGAGVVFLAIEKEEPWILLGLFGIVGTMVFLPRLLPRV
jgi:hypothetical protein